MASINAGLGGAAGYGEGVFSSAPKAAGGNDDGSVEVDISSVFGGAGLKFFDASYSSLYVNSNGLISFGAADTSYAGGDLGDLANPAIAPFWADHNIESGGEIYWDLDPSEGKVTITWDSVAPYSGSGTNTYQVVIQDTGDGNIEVEFIYEDIEWHQSGGGHAVTGVTDGAGTQFELDGSGEANNLNKYDQHDFEGGDEAGTFKLPFTDGSPDTRNGTVDGTGGGDNFSVSNPGLGLGKDKDGDAVSDGADKVLTGLGNDYVESGAGEDTIHGGEGSDTILGGEGADEIYGDGISDEAEATTTSISASNFSDTSSGFSVTARIIENGVLSTASADNVATTMGGFGAGGHISDSDSNVAQQTGYDLASGQSEQLIVEFDEPVSDASFSFSVLYTNSFGEQAQWAIYDDGNLVAQSSFTESSPGGGSGTIDLSGHGQFDQIIFTGLPQSDGTDGSDFLITDVTFTTTPESTGYDDDLSGGEGMDSIYGGLGSDKISGDAGDDTIFGENGDDNISGGTGNDSVLGGIGADSISGGEGDDYIEGGEGDDVLKTGFGNDTLMGGEGNDTLMNSAGDDSLVGGVGDDLIVATAGQDTLEGGDGADTLMGGTDGDSLVGGDGNDVLLGDLAGIRFNESGTNGVASVSNVADFPTDALSYEITFSSEADTSGKTILASYATGSGPSANEFLLEVTDDELTLIVGGSGSLPTGLDVSGLFDGQVHTIGVTWDSATGEVAIYSDGTSVYTGN